MGKRVALEFLMVVFLTFMGVAACGNQPATIVGAITGSDNQPVPGAQIAVYALERAQGEGAFSAFTKGAMVKAIDADNNGLYTALFDPGDYVFEVTAEGWQTTSHMVEAKAGQELTIDFRLAAP